jgi:drug/metabolite transporter (DMT)-like permease
VGVLAISTGAVLVRLAIAAMAGIAVNRMGFSLVMAASRMTIAALLVAPGWRSLRSVSAMVSPIAIRYSVAAGLWLAIHFATWILSLSYTSIAASTTLVTTNPIWVALISWWWWQETIARLTWVGIAIAFGGAGLIGSATVVNETMVNPLLGNGLALTGAVAASLYLLLGREAQRQGLTTRNHILIAYSVAAIVLLPMPLMFGTGYGGYPAITYLWFGLMALIPQMIGHTSFNWAVNQISPTLVTLAILLEPIGASGLGYLIFQEVPSGSMAIGAAVVLLGVGVATWGNVTHC